MQIIHDVMPSKAKTLMDALIQTSQDSVIKLEGEPASTLDFVNLLQYVVIQYIAELIIILVLYFAQPISGIL